MMTELERRAALAGAIAGPNSSYDSAIDSLPDEISQCYCELAASSPSSVSFRRSSFVGGQAGHMALSPSMAAAASSATAGAPYHCKSLNGPLSSNNSNSHNPTAQLPLANGALFYRSLADYHRLYNNSNSNTLSSHLSTEHPSIVATAAAANGTARQIPTDRPKSRTSRTNMAMFLDQIDASSSAFHGNGQTPHPAAESCLTRSTTAAGHRQCSSRGATGSGCPKRSSGSEQSPAASANDITDDRPQHDAHRSVRHPDESERQRVFPVHSPTADLSASSLLRSSRSFTSRHCQRPNVTLIRRKSASERLAESRSKYIRSDLTEPEDAFEVNTEAADCCHSCVRRSTDEDQLTNDAHCHHHLTGCTMRLLRATPTSTKSSHTSSSRLSPISDHVAPGAEERGQSLHSQGNLVDRINSQLNKSKQYSASSCCPKKRVSPRNSDGSTLPYGMSNLEMKLRELITIDSGTESLATPPVPENNQMPKSVAQFPLEAESAGDSSGDARRHLSEQHEREAHHIYRAELKFIGSSTSSLSSMYSEPNQESLSPVEHRFNHLSQLCQKSDTVAPPGALETNRTCQKQHQPNVVRSKSDVSPEKQQQVTERFRSRHIERLLGSLGLDSSFCQSVDSAGHSLGANHKSSQSGGHSNPHPHSLGSPSHESLYKREKDLVDSRSLQPTAKSKPTMALCTPKSFSTNELSSLESSQLSVSENLFKSALNPHSKSTSKLTFENLMMHQQSLASSRSCHNLVPSLQSGPSVVERNARIIKWLFNCRKAMMDQTPTQLHTCS